MTATAETPHIGRTERVLAGAVQRFKRLLLRFILQPTFRLEADLAARSDVVHAGPTSPRRIEIVEKSIEVAGLHRPMPGFPRSLPHVLSSARNIRASLKEVADNPATPITSMDKEARVELEGFMHAVGIDAFGYTTVPAELIFEGKAVLHPHAIVLAMEMDKARMDTAPSPDTAVMVHETYDELGIAANRIARFLRARGLLRPGRPSPRRTYPLSATGRGSRPGARRHARPAHHATVRAAGPIGSRLHQHLGPARKRYRCARLDRRFLSRVRQMRAAVPSRSHPPAAAPLRQRPRCLRRRGTLPALLRAP